MRRVTDPFFSCFFRYFLAARGAALLAVAAALSGCAATPRSEAPPVCPRPANWQEQGRQDGLQGHAQPWLQRYLAACAPVGVAVDQAAWLLGWQQGMVAFCTPAQGAAWGGQGKPYRMGHCPAPSEAQFLAGYTPAYEQFRFRAALRQKQGQIDRKTGELNRVIAEMARPDRQDEAAQNVLAARREILENEIRNLHSQMQTETLIRSLP